MKKRVLIGIICALLALAAVVFWGPLVNTVTQETTEAVHLIEIEAQVSQISANDLLIYVLLGVTIGCARNIIINLEDDESGRALAWFLGFIIALSGFLVMYNETRVHCSVCGETVASDDVFCPSCGEPQETVLPDGTIDPATAPMDIADQPATVCESCENTIEENDIFCPHCGNSLTETAFCNNCGEPIDGDDTYCSHCGEPQT